METSSLPVRRRQRAADPINARMSMTGLSRHHGRIRRVDADAARCHRQGSRPRRARCRQRSWPNRLLRDALAQRRPLSFRPAHQRRPDSCPAETHSTAAVTVVPSCRIRHGGLRLPPLRKRVRAGRGDRKEGRAWPVADDLIEHQAGWTDDGRKVARLPFEFAPACDGKGTEV